MSLIHKTPLVIAEIAQAHDGSVGMAHAFIDAVAESGAHAIKFQTHIAAAESTAREPWRVPFSSQDKTRYDYWRRMEFTREQWAELAAHARAKKLIFLSSPFSLEAVSLLDSLGMEVWKIGSGEIDNTLLIEAALATGKPLLISTGMSPWAEIDKLYHHLKERKAHFGLMHCTSEYPVPPAHFGLNCITEFKRRYDCPVGLSSHLPATGPLLAAYALGASIIETHVTFDRSMFGPDTKSSLTFTELKSLVAELELVAEINRQPLDKDRMADQLSETRAKFRKSVVAARELKKGAVLSLTDLAYKKPGDGLPVAQHAQLLGKTLLRDLQRDDVILPEHVK